MAKRVCCLLFLAACSSPPGGTDGGPDGGAAPDMLGDAALPPSQAYCPTGANTTSAAGADVTLDIDVGLGPLQQAFGGAAAMQVPAPLAVSEYVYGINQYPENNYFIHYNKTKFGLMRWGGDSYSDWNWTNNADNVGADNGFTNTNQFMPFSYGNDPTDPAYPGNAHDTNMCGAIVDGSDSVPVAQTRGMATLVSVSLQDWVAANANDQTVTYAPSADFVANKPAQAAGGGTVYQDAFVQYMQAHYAAQPIFYSLDNEPNYWKGTHPEVFGTNDLSFDELVNRNATFAAAIKAVAPSAMVFGPVVAGIDGMTSLDDYGNLATTNPYAMSGTDAIEYYLAGMSARSTTAGMRLLDVLDLHYYNDTKDKTGTAKSATDCAQGPRDFWDGAYSTVDTTYDDYITGWKPRALVPRMQAKINANYPGTKMAFSEYNNGCEGEAAGGVAEADTLGVFGQYGVFAATAWPLKNAMPGNNWLIGAFGAYRNYDGNGAVVGALTTASSSSDISKASIYGFVSPGTTGVQVVAINKTTAALAAEIRLSNACAVTSATPYQLTQANSAMMSAGSAITVAGNAFRYTLPPMSVTTFALQ
jgi:mannan endo-1,4-beta-mannosidase